jgi:hypothetical protein
MQDLFCTLWIRLSLCSKRYMAVEMGNNHVNLYILVNNIIQNGKQNEFEFVLC